MSWLFRVGHPVATLHTDNFSASVIYGDGDITPRAVSPLTAPSNLSSTIPPPSSTGKTVQFADEPPQSLSDSELDRPSSRRSDGPRRRSGKRNESPASDGSEETIDLPQRFDKNGQPIRKDSVADAVEAFLLSISGDKSNGGSSSRRRRSSDNYVRRDRDRRNDRDR
jgi:hypothetical protein